MGIGEDTTRKVQGRAIGHADGGVLLQVDLTTQCIDTGEGCERNVTEATSVHRLGADRDVIKERDTARERNRRIISIVNRQDGIRHDGRGVGDDQRTLVNPDTTDDQLQGPWIRDGTRTRELPSGTEDKRAITRLDESRR